MRGLKIQPGTGSRLYPSGSSVGGSPTPPIPTTDLYQWFKADAITGLVNNDPVTTWANSFGAGSDATQSVGADKPIYTTNAVNGLPAVAFDGVSDYLELGDLSALTAGMVFVVIKLDADPPTLGDGLWTIGADATAGTRWPFSDGNIYDEWGTTVRKTTGNPTPNLATWNIYSVQSSAGNWTSAFNGVQHYTTATNTVGFNTSAFLGRSFQAPSNFWLDGQIAEYIMYAAIPTVGEIATIESYLTTKYGL